MLLMSADDVRNNRAGCDSYLVVGMLLLFDSVLPLKGNDHSIACVVAN